MSGRRAKRMATAATVTPREIQKYKKRSPSRSVTRLSAPPRGAGRLVDSLVVATTSTRTRTKPYPSSSPSSEKLRLSTANAKKKPPRRLERAVLLPEGVVVVVPETGAASPKRRRGGREAYGSPERMASFESRAAVVRPVGRQAAVAALPLGAQRDVAERAGWCQKARVDTTLKIAERGLPLRYLAEQRWLDAARSDGARVIFTFFIPTIVQSLSCWREGALADPLSVESATALSLSLSLVGNRKLLALSRARRRCGPSRDARAVSRLFFALLREEEEEEEEEEEDAEEYSRATFALVCHVYGR